MSKPSTIRVRDSRGRFVRPESFAEIKLWVDGRLKQWFVGGSDSYRIFPTEESAKRFVNAIRPA